MYFSKIHSEFIKENIKSLSRKDQVFEKQLLVFHVDLFIDLGIHGDSKLKLMLLRL